MKHIIIGGAAAGATAAARIRRIDEFAEILLIERSKYISYANCGLPYYISGTIERREDLLLHAPEMLGKRFEIDMRVENEAVEIDPIAKIVTIRRADGSLYTESYDRLLLSPGASPVIPQIDGISHDGIFTLRDVADSDNIKNYMARHRIQSAVVVGAGFIGLEMVHNLHNAGTQVSVIEANDQVMAPLDFSMAAYVHSHLTQQGIALFLNKAIESFNRANGRICIRLKSGEELVTDIVIISAGVRPETALARQAGIAIGETGGIRVDKYLETSVKDIYAAGNAIEFPHPLTNKPWLNYLANPANRQGRIAADNMVNGKTVEYEGAIGTAIARVFDITAAATGLAAKHLKASAIPYMSSTIHATSHAAYYPGAMPLTIKLTFAPGSGKLYGAQCVGREGVDKRIDQIALLIKKGGTVYDLTRLEQAYAPPFSSAKDPIAIAGYAAANIVDGTMPSITWREMESAPRESVTILDVRTPEEFDAGAIPGAINIPIDDLRSRISEIPAGKPVYVYCAAGLRGSLALRTLTARGFTEVKNLSGGYTTYSTATQSFPAPQHLSERQKVQSC